MSWIQIVDPTAAQGELAHLYTAIDKAHGGIANLHRALSLNPRALQDHLSLYMTTVFAESPLSRGLRERIGTIVSATNGCEYSVQRHAASARELGTPPDVATALTRAQVPENVRADERMLLEWAKRATVAPGDAAEADVQALRAAGWSDRAILDATMAIAYFNFCNRIVMLLGVEPEDESSAG